jgi:hypothetical protein
MTRPIIVLLGRVEEYCRYLGNALRLHDFQLEIRCLPWQIRGWPKAPRALRLQAAPLTLRLDAVQHRSCLVPRVLKTLKSADARLGLLLHDVEPYLAGALSILPALSANSLDRSDLACSV